MSDNNSSKMENFLFRRGGKYLIVGMSISAIHTFYLIFFYMIACFPMTIYNVLCITGYLLFSAEAYKGSSIRKFYLFSIIEIPIHCVLSTLFVGFEYQFMFVLVSSIPLVFYFILFLDEFKNAVRLATLISVGYIILFICMRLHYAFINITLINITKNSEAYESFFSYFNTIIGFFNLIFFNYLFAVEYMYIKKKLVSENTKLDTYATYDPLTGLLNRRSTESRLQRLFDIHYHNEDAFSVIMCDIDKFKSVNDTYGHDAGDFVLKEVSWILKDQVRENDAVGRWGGEEFLILVSGNKANASILAERIRMMVEQHTYTYKNLELHVTITLGVSSYHSNSDVDSLIKSADNKLYRGKENGRNQVVS